MQKVITVTSRTDFFREGGEFKEMEFPELNKYLEEGYVVAHTIPIVPHESYMYAITFVLQK